MIPLLSLLLLVSGVFTNKLRRMASDSFDAFTKLPPIEKIPLQDPVPDSGQNETIVNTPQKFNIDEIKTPLDLIDTTEQLTTEPYLVNHDFPEKEVTVTQTDWFNPFTNTPWANKAGKFYTVEMDNETEEKEGGDNQSNSNAISSSASIFRVNRTWLGLMAILYTLFLCL